jgi:hypothetical protein
MHDLLDINLRARLALAFGAILVALTFAVALPGQAMAADCAPEHVRLSISKVGSMIYGYGGFYNCTGRPGATITLERDRGLWWDELSSKYGPFTPNSAVRLSYNCAGKGTYTYRISLSGRRVSGLPWFKSTTLRVTC